MDQGSERQEQESEQVGLGERAIRRSHSHDLGRHVESSDGLDRGLTALFSRGLREPAERTACRVRDRIGG